MDFEIGTISMKQTIDMAGELAKVINRKLESMNLAPDPTNAGKIVCALAHLQTSYAKQVGLSNLRAMVGSVFDFQGFPDDPEDGAAVGRDVTG